MDSLLYFSSTSQAKLSLPSSSNIYTSLNTYLSLLKYKPAISLPVKLFSSIYDASQLRLNYHSAFLFGVSCVLWSGHLIHKALPVSRGHSVSFLSTTSNNLLNGNLGDLANNFDSDNHIWSSSLGAGDSILSFSGQIRPDTNSLYISDMAHHHLSLGLLLCILSQFYTTLNKGYGQSIRDIASSHSSNLVSFLSNSLNINLALCLFALGLVSSLLAQHTNALLPFCFINFTTTVSLFCHHQYIASLLSVGGLFHVSIALLRDVESPSTLLSTSSKLSSPYTSSIQTYLLTDVLTTKGSLISHLSWVSLFLGFHTLGLYIHNDVVVAFSNPDAAILLEPVFALSFIRVSAVLSQGLGTGDLLVHHAIALGLHLTTLILVKGSLDARSSRLFPDKHNYMISFA